MVSGLSGGIIRDILLGALPPATFSDWRYLAVAAAGGLAAFAPGRQLARLATLITLLDAAGLGLFAVTGASKALGLGLGAAPAVILGAVAGVGGGRCETFSAGTSRRCCSAGYTPSRPCPPRRSPSPRSEQEPTGRPQRPAPCSPASSSGSSASATT
jgi:Glycine transporter